jgi:uncharacterized protein (TIGR02118 family)
MVRVTVLYTNHPGSRFDVEYYLNTHVPLASKLLEPVVKDLTVDVGASGAAPDTPPPFAAIFAITCESAQAFAEAFMPNAAELQGDIPNYTDIIPILQISDIRIG